MNKFNGLTIDLSALASNWHYLNSQLKNSSECAAVVKANAYGVGVNEVVARLVRGGCKHFFVANLEEGLQIKSLLSKDEKLFVLSGCREGEERVFLKQNIIPVIISLPMYQRWLKVCQTSVDLAPVAAVKINTGMNRLGMEIEEWQSLLAEKNHVKRAGVQWVMSHLACADEPEHKLNKVQLQRFKFVVEETRKVLPECRFSLANSAGIFLGEEYHFDLVRPGVALYGGQPQIIERRLKPLVYLNLDVLQTRVSKADESVGYGATVSFDKERSLLVVGAGYADGFFRSLSNKSEACFNGKRFPQVGRVSMDSLIFDVSDLSESARPQVGDLIELLGKNITVNELALKAGTISYEILTSLGQRYPRRYID